MKTTVERRLSDLATACEAWLRDADTGVIEVPKDSTLYLFTKYLLARERMAE